MHYPERYAGTVTASVFMMGKETIIDFKQSPINQKNLNT